MAKMRGPVSESTPSYSLENSVIHRSGKTGYFLSLFPLFEVGHNKFLLGCGYLVNQTDAAQAGLEVNDAGVSQSRHSDMERMDLRRF